MASQGPLNPPVTGEEELGHNSPPHTPPEKEHPSDDEQQHSGGEEGGENVEEDDDDVPKKRKSDKQSSNLPISLNPGDYHKRQRVIIEFLSKHFLSDALSVIPSSFPRSLVKLSMDTLVDNEDEGKTVTVTLMDGKKVTITRKMYLEAIGLRENPED